MKDIAKEPSISKKSKKKTKKNNYNELFSTDMKKPCCHKVRCVFSMCMSIIVFCMYSILHDVHFHHFLSLFCWNHFVWKYRSFPQRPNQRRSQ